MTKILFIEPKIPNNAMSDYLFSVRKGRKYSFPPLGITTIAALCPAAWEVAILDENVEALPDDPMVDIVAFGGMAVHLPRQIELIKKYKSLGMFVIVGGVGATSVYLSCKTYQGHPQYIAFFLEVRAVYDKYVDAIFSGEGEGIFRQFIDDYQDGNHQKWYIEEQGVDMAESPIPRYDLIRMELYSSLSIQRSRGCPYKCEFCDVIELFGRKPRVKSDEQIIEELEFIYRHLDPVRASGFLFITDDNFIGDVRGLKGFLDKLEAFQKTIDYFFEFYTQITINAVKIKGLLQRLADVRLTSVFIGIETPNVASLIQTDKKQNAKLEMDRCVDEFLAHGIFVYPGIIVGFDPDDTSIFQVQFDFLIRTGLAHVALPGVLIAPPNTPLFDRLLAENRLRGDATAYSTNTAVMTNIEPKGMSYDELIEGYIELKKNLFVDRNIYESILIRFRNLNADQYFKFSSRNNYIDFQSLWGLIDRFFIKDSGGFKRLLWVLKALTRNDKRLWPIIIAEWVYGRAANYDLESAMAFDGAQPEAQPNTKEYAILTSSSVDS